jgi:hypothetical protein
MPNHDTNPRVCIIGLELYAWLEDPVARGILMEALDECRSKLTSREPPDILTHLEGLMDGLDSMHPGVEEGSNVSADSRSTVLFTSAVHAVLVEVVHPADEIAVESVGPVPV